MLTSGEVTWRRSSPSGPCAAEGPQQSSVLTDETPGSVQIGDKGLEQSRTGEKKPHDSNVSFPGVATSGLLCHRFGHRTTRITQEDQPGSPWMKPSAVAGDDQDGISVR